MLMSFSEEQENFLGNDKHLKVLRKAIESENMAVWNEFSSSLGPHFKADLRGADLQGQTLCGINLRGARLDEVCFDGCDLSSADLTGAVLNGATFRGATLNATKMKVPVRVKAKVKAVETTEAPESPDIRRRKRMAAMQESAEALLAERQKNQQAQDELHARIKEKNRGSAFRNNNDDN